MLPGGASSDVEPAAGLFFEEKRELLLDILEFLLSFVDSSGRATDLRAGKSGMEQERVVRQEPHYFSDRLLDRLDGLRLAPAAVVQAPSGYGKTTAVRDFLRTREFLGACVRWLIAASEAPASGYLRLCREISEIDDRAGERLRNVRLPNAANIGEACDALRSIRCARETYLVIDNFHMLYAGLPHAFFPALIEHGGENLHVVLITQTLSRRMLSAVQARAIPFITAKDLRLGAEDVRRYFEMAGVRLTPDRIWDIARHTQGWIIAVHLQLRALRETGSFSSAPDIATLMERLIWNALTDEQQAFLLRLSPFETITARQACALAGCEALPEPLKDALESPLIHYEQGAARYELHSILTELLISKRRERGRAFERECLMRSGDLCRDEGRAAEALNFYAQAGDYGRMLSLDLAPLALEMIGETPFWVLARDIAENCPPEIRAERILPMLQVAYALLRAGMHALFDALMDELRPAIEAGKGEDAGRLRGEWLLLASLRAFPQLQQMTALIQQAAPLFGGCCSRVILPATLWFFVTCSPLAEFHTEPGQADLEAERLEEYVELYARLTGGHGSGAAALYRAELAYQRGDLASTEIHAHKALFLAEGSRQGDIQLVATQQLAQSALHRADPDGWQKAIRSMERAASAPARSALITRLIVDTVRGVLFNEMQQLDDLADWLQNGDLSDPRLPPPVRDTAAFVYINLLMHRGEYARLIGFGEAILQQTGKIQPFRDSLLSLLLAVGYLGLGDRGKAAAQVERAARQALPDGLIFPLASYSTLLDGLVEEEIQRRYPGHWERFREVRRRFVTGWSALHSAIFAGDLPEDLSPREYEVARLAAQGLRNAEIAKKLCVSENTVRAHLRTVFQKMDIDRRARLAEKLK